MNRRDFLKISGLSVLSIAVSGAAFRVGAHWWDQSAGHGLAVLSQEEAAIVGAIADTLFPGEQAAMGGMPAATEVGIVAFFDDYLTTIEEIPANLLRALLHAVDDVAVLAGGGGGRFRFRPRREREAILRAWDESAFAPRRRAFFGLKILLAMGYTESPAVIAAAGWDFGCTTLQPPAPRIDALAHGGAG